MNDHDLLITAAGVIPLLLLVLATEDRLGLVKPEWRTGWRLNAIAVLLGALVVGEPVALGGLRRDPAPFPAVAYVITVIGAASVLMVWGIGWSIWYRYEEDVPEPGTWAKRLFYAIGVSVAIGVGVVSAWALRA